MMLNGHKSLRLSGAYTAFCIDSELNSVEVVSDLFLRGRLTSKIPLHVRGRL